MSTTSWARPHHPIHFKSKPDCDSHDVGCKSPDDDTKPSTRLRSAPRRFSLARGSLFRCCDVVMDVVATRERRMSFCFYFLSPLGPLHEAARFYKKQVAFGPHNPNQEVCAPSPSSSRLAPPPGVVCLFCLNRAFFCCWNSLFFGLKAL